MKRIFSLSARIILVIFPLILFGISLSDSLAASKKFTLTFATNTAPVDYRGTVEKLWIEEIEKHTKGMVKIQPYWGESLLKGKEILKGVQDNVTNFGQVNINYYPKRLLTNSAIVLFQEGPQKFENILWIYHKMYNEIPAMNGEFEKFNQKPIFAYTVLPTATCFTQPVKTLDDFKGKRIRAASRWALAVLKGTGATPVSVPWGDCYMALQTKSIEGVYTNYDSLHRTKLYEPAPYVYVTKQLWMPTPYLININLSTWKKLPKDIQDQISQAGKAAENRVADLYAKWFDKIVQEERKLGCTVTIATDKEIDQWTSMPEVKQIQDQWLTEVKKAGLKDAEKVLRQVEEIVKAGIRKEK
jgi:TRAP-type C4-dicarboxylate transport system substrate-binding protein